MGIPANAVRAPGASVDADYPLSFTQRGLLVLSSLVRGAGELQGGITLRQRHDEDDVRTAIQRLVARQDAMTYVCSSTTEGMRQRPSAVEPELLVHHREDRVFPAGADGGNARTPEAHQMRRELDLARLDPHGGRMAAFGAVLWADATEVAFKLNHVVSDTSSIPVAQHDLTAAFAGELPPLAGTQGQYAASVVAAWNGADGDRIRQYWASTLAGAPPMTLPGLRGSFAPIAGRRTDEYVAPVLEGPALDALARGARSTPFAVLVAAAAAGLRDVTRHHDVLMKTFLRDRTPQFNETVGCFMNTVPLRLVVGDDDRANIRTAQRALIGALRHQRADWDELGATVPELAYVRSRLHPQINIDYLDHATDVRDLETAERAEQRDPAVINDIAIRFARGGGNDMVRCYALYRPDICEREGVAEFCDRVRDRLTRLVEA